MASCGTITVRPAFESSNVTASCDVGNTSITAGDTVEITATVENDNDVRASYDLTFEVGDAVEETVSGSVSADGSSSESITVEIQDPGEYDVSTSVQSSRD